MEQKKSEPNPIDEYISACDPAVQGLLQEFRSVILEEVPEGTTERISWQMPTFTWNGNLVHFAAQAKHLGFYPGSSGVENFTEKLAEYHTSKGAIQFPYQKPIPYELVREIVRFRVKENAAEAEQKAAKGKKK